jgi:hypothetical protein
MPKAKRDDGAKLFMGELTKTDNAGKNSPGPVYMFSDNVKYDQVGIQLYFKFQRSYKIAPIII